MADRISCREGVYGGWQTAADCLPEAGIRFIELDVRERGELRTAADGCRAKGVTPLTIAGGVDACNAASVDAAMAACEAARDIGVQFFFLSAHGADRAAAMKALAGLGRHAAGCGVTICLETHPPFCANTADMLGTMAEVNHPNVRINFDTANVMFYNKGVNSADELEKAIGHVASLHLKDTDGAFQAFNFPVLGEGVVEFPRIFPALHRAKFGGPLTIELEGPVVDNLDAAGRHAAVAACMRYLGKLIA